MALNLALKKIPNAGDRVIDEATGITVVHVAGGMSAANGLLTVVGEGRTALAVGAMDITLHASTPCEYFYFWLDDGASTVHYKATGVNATGTTDVPQFASMGPRIIKLATPATTIRLWGTGILGNVNWIAGN